jgi:hypothetical protein
MATSATSTVTAMAPGLVNAVPASDEGASVVAVVLIGWPASPGVGEDNGLGACTLVGVGRGLSWAWAGRGDANAPMIRNATKRATINCWRQPGKLGCDMMTSP